MSPAERIRTVATDAITEALAVAETHTGLCGAAIAIEGIQVAISNFLVARVGPDLAYETLQRTCDRIARRVADEAPAHQQGQSR